MLDTVGIRIHRKYLASFTQQMHKISPVPASSVEHTHARGDISSQYLIEDVDIDLPKLLLNIECHAVTLPVVDTRDRCCSVSGSL